MMSKKISIATILNKPSAIIFTNANQNSTSPKNFTLVRFMIVTNKLNKVAYIYVGTAGKMYAEIIPPAIHS